MSRVENRKLGKLLKKMKRGDILICSELSRLGRNLLMIMGVLNECMNRDIQVWTIKNKGLGVGQEVVEALGELAADLTGLGQGLRAGAPQVLGQGGHGGLLLVEPGRVGVGEVLTTAEATLKVMKPLSLQGVKTDLNLCQTSATYRDVEDLMYRASQ